MASACHTPRLQPEWRGSARTGVTALLKSQHLLRKPRAAASVPQRASPHLHSFALGQKHALGFAQGICDKALGKDGQQLSGWQ